MSSIHIEYRDLPDWAKGVLADIGMRPTSIEVRIGEGAAIPGSWHDNNRPTLYLFDAAFNRVSRIDGNYGGSSNMFSAAADPAARSLNRGFSVTLTDNVMLMLVNSYPKSVRMFVHPDSLLAKLPPKDEGVTWAMRVVLVATRSLKSSYGGDPNYRRSEAVSTTGIAVTAYNEARHECVKQGYLTARGAITAAGRTIAGATQLHQMRKLLKED